MEIWQIWLAIALALVIIEIITVGFAALCLAIGAVGAASSGIVFHRLFGMANYGFCRFHFNIIHLCTSIHA